MKLLFDIGNSRLKWAWWKQGLKAGGALTHAGQSPEKVLEALDAGIRPDEVWAASVAAPGLRQGLEAWVMRHHALPVRWVVSQAEACGVRNAYAQPEKLGVDRWLAMIAARRRAAGAVFVVDAGTALTLDVVDAQGSHRGGLIAPGLDTQRRSLLSHTQLRAVPFAGLPAWLGTDTDMAVTWGALHGAIGMIMRVHEAICSEHPGITSIITGGDAHWLLPYLGPDWQHLPELVLEGLGHVASRPAAESA